MRAFLPDLPSGQGPSGRRFPVLWKREREKGILDAETAVPSSVISHKAGYIDKDLETIVGLQTDKPLKRGIDGPGRAPGCRGCTGIIRLQSG